MENYETIKIILERGIEIDKNENGKWYIGSTDNIIDPNTFISKYKLRPIIRVNKIRSDFEISMLLPYTKQYSTSFDVNRMLDIRHSLLVTGQGEKLNEKANIWSYMKNLEYITGSAIYHCKRLAYKYLDITHEYSRFSIKSEKEYDNYQFMNQNEGYYEFDALITVARRVYDTTRFILWKNFGAEKDSIPSTFKKVLCLCKDNMQEKLGNLLDSSWKKFGEKLTDYRDCIQHYVSLDYNNSSAIMNPLESNIWSASLMIPDNPKARSKEQFLFKSKIDALTYGWEITTELVDIALEIVNSTPINKITN